MLHNMPLAWYQKPISSWLKIHIFRSGVEGEDENDGAADWSAAGGRPE